VPGAGVRPYRHAASAAPAGATRVRSQRQAQPTLVLPKPAARQSAPPRRTGPPRPRPAPARPVARQAGATGTVTPRARPAVTLEQQRAGLTARAVVPRMPFVLLVLTLLGGSLICLLVINTTLGAASFRVSQLQKTGAGLATQLQGVRQRVAAEQAPAAIAQRAYQLGMRTLTNVSILDLRTHQIDVLDGQSGVGVQLGASPAASAAAKKPAASASAAASSTPTPASSAAPTPAVSSTPTPAGSSQ
jgi:hypothetical protein